MRKAPAPGVDQSLADRPHRGFRGISGDDNRRPAVRRDPL